ncbi:MAG TPA: peptidylprolyl isomerase [Rhizomicrobium sp.]|nr:peptidylprolyl isomerase [Rhizomicrobium sp.]
MRASLFTLAAILCLAAGTAFAQGLSSDSVTNQTPAPADSSSGSATNAAPADAAANTPPPDPHAIDPSIPAMTGPQIVIASSMGNITLQLDSVRAPKTTANVLRYVKLKHYDGTVFYRVVKGALIQMGSWDARGVGRSGFAAKLPLEVNNGLSNVRGTVGLARGEEPDTGGADFFINVGDESPLDAAKDVPGNTTGYAVFAKVIGGMDVVDAINNVTTGGDGPMPGQAPMMPIVINKVTIVPGTDNSPPEPAAKAAAKAVPVKKSEPRRQ